MNNDRLCDNLRMETTLVSGIGNFSANVFRVIKQANAKTRTKLKTVFPVETEMVHIYWTQQPRKDDGTVDWEKIENIAKRNVELRKRRSKS